MMNKEVIMSYVFDRNGSHKPGVVTHVCNPRTQGVEAGGSEIQRHPLFHIKFKFTLDDIKTLSQKPDPSKLLLLMSTPLLNLTVLLLMLRDLVYSSSG